MEAGIQLEMNFETNRNRLRGNLNGGEFFVLFEVNTPSRQADLEVSRERLRDMEFAAAGVGTLSTGLALTERPGGSADSWDMAEFAEALAPDERDRHLIVLSGRDKREEELLATARLCGNSGFTNMVLVSGNSHSGENSRQTSKRNFCESVNAIYELRKRYQREFHIGCGVNPYKYNPGDLFAQYFKLIKKLHFGADFFVTNFGWDMLKLQELRWYLESRGLHIPAIARVMMLSPDRLESISKGGYPGVHLSPDLNIILQNESKYSFAQFESAQWRRIQLQAAGCKLLGYNGIQLAGVERPDKLRTAAARISEALEEFKHFEDWRKAYHEYLARAEMAPYPYRFYLFNQLFSQAYYDGGQRMNEGQMPGAGRWERFYYHICDFMFRHAHKQAPGEHLLSKRLLAGCMLCERCRLPQTHYVCPRTCPKGLSNGPCGGSRVDGECELGGKPCVHGRTLRLALWRHEADALEERYVRSGWV